MQAGYVGFFFFKGAVPRSDCRVEGRSLLGADHHRLRSDRMTDFMHEYVLKESIRREVLLLLRIDQAETHRPYNRVKPRFEHVLPECLLRPLLRLHFGIVREVRGNGLIACDRLTSPDDIADDHELRGQARNLRLVLRWNWKIILEVLEVTNVHIKFSGLLLIDYFDTRFVFGFDSLDPIGIGFERSEDDVKLAPLHIDPGGIGIEVVIR